MVMEFPEKSETLPDQNNIGLKLYDRDDAIMNLMKENIFHNFLWDKLYRKELMVNKFQPSPLGFVRSLFRMPLQTARR